MLQLSTMVFHIRSATDGARLICIAAPSEIDSKLSAMALVMMEVLTIDDTSLKINNTTLSPAPLIISPGVMRKISSASSTNKGHWILS